jgi:hypothetical protein
MKVEEALMVLKQAVTPQFNNPRTLEAFNMLRQALQKLKCPDCSGYEPDDHDILCPLTMRRAEAELRERFRHG